MPSAPDSSRSQNGSGLSLNELQRWFLDQVIGPHRTGNPAPAVVPAPEREISAVVLPSATLTAEQRMNIYAQQYILRLHGIVSDRHPTIERLLGADRFAEVATDYLSRFPPYGYTLNNLCHAFPHYVERYLEHDEHALLCELVTLERAISDAYDTYVVGRVSPDDLASVPAEQWPEVRFRLDPSVRILSFEYDVLAIYDSVKEDAPLPPRTPKQTRVAVWRQGGLVWRQPIARARHAILSAFAENQTVTVALERASNVWEGDEEELAQTVFSWFSTWVQEDFFSAIVLPNAR